MSRYKNAKMQLVAGDVNRVQQNIRPMMKTMRGEVAMADAAAPMAEEGLLEYHLYTLDRPTTIAENQTKQVALLSASGVPVHKDLVLQGADYYYTGQFGEIGTKMKVGVFVQFENKETANLGMPLPKGTLRVYKRDSKGNAQFVGEDRIDPAPQPRGKGGVLPHLLERRGRHRQPADPTRQFIDPGRYEHMFDDTELM